MFADDPALAGNVDGFALHPYGATASDVLKWVAEFRSVLVPRNEGSAPIDITEIGWQYGANPESWRASQMQTVAAALTNSNCGIRLLEPYDWINPGTTPANDWGLVDPSASTTALRPAGNAWFTGLARATIRQQTISADQPSWSSRILRPRAARPCGGAVRLR